MELPLAPLPRRSGHAHEMTAEPGSGSDEETSHFTLAQAAFGMHTIPCASWSLKMISWSLKMISCNQEP
eukprot:366182-Chlamydomonas_euryale.AAC.5